MSDSTTSERRCYKCKEYFPETSEYFPRVKGKLAYICKPCNQKHAEDWIAQNREKYLEKKRLWRERNREKLRKQESDRYWAERDNKLEYARQYRETHRGILREKTKQYFTQNPQVLKQQNRRRKSRMRNLPHTFTEAQECQMLAYWDYKCAGCGKHAGIWIKLVPDHWIAISDPRPDNPGTVATNMIPLCHSKPGIPAGESCCNESKKNKPAYEWLVQRFGKRKADQIMKRIQAYFEWVKLTP